MEKIDHLAIVGGGFSGALLAINLLRHEGPRATLVERRPRIGPGVAYSTGCADHLLNVRAANMSALPDDPDHFVRWLDAHGGGSGDAFAPRALYGRYLTELIDEARARAPERLRVIQAEAVSIAAPRGRFEIGLADGPAVVADAAVLALGNLPPVVPEPLDPAALGPTRYVSDPWAGSLAEGLTDEDHVLVLGTGLTMVDVVLSLEAQGFGGRVTALSRRGLVPLRHALGPAVATRLQDRPAAEVSVLLRTVRRRADAIGWREAIDELRPFTQSMWLAWSEEQRRRFLRHLRPWWDNHRHRIAPAVGDCLDALRRSGRLRILAGRALAFEPEGNGVRVAWQPRGSSERAELAARLVVNCTGPQSDLARATDPLLVQLTRSGQVVADPLGLGLAIDPQSRLIDATGKPNRRLFALGPMTRGTFWEITAVPDIRLQAWSVARYLSNAHWAEGEGL